MPVKAKQLQAALEAQAQKPQPAPREKTVMLCTRVPFRVRAGFRKILARCPEKQQQDLMEEAIGYLFQKYEVEELP